MESFKALRVHQGKDRSVETRLETLHLGDLDDGEVVVRTRWSDINYKDALAITGAGKIMRRFPMVAGIDLAGEVVSSQDPRFQLGDQVVVIGSGLGEERDGGYSEIVRLPADIVIPLPSDLTLYEAMAIGTAGFTAALAIHRLEENGQHPDLGPVLVNGATGGVGSFAIDMLAARGYQVTAFTGKAQAADYLRQLGAHQVLLRGETELGSRPLERALWGGALDSVGGEELAWLTRTVVPLGNIASIGLAGGHQLNTTVMPFILRGVSLLGINSVLIPKELKQRVLARCGADLRPRHLELIVNRQVSLEELPALAADYVAGTITGRTVVKLGEH
jgi:NADPH2:quinone reductase